MNYLGQLTREESSIFPRIEDFIWRRINVKFRLLSPFYNVPNVQEDNDIEGG